MLRSDRTATLNAAIQTELTVGANLSARLELFTTHTLTADLSARLSTSTLENGLISYWKLDGNSTDELGTNNGTDTAVSYLLGGKINGDAKFNGTTSRVMLPSSIKPTNVTVSAWIRTTKTGTYDGIFSSYKQDLVFAAGVVIYNDPTGNLEFYVGNHTNLTPGSGYGSVVSTTPINTGAFVHVACSYDGATMRSYINGVAAGVTAYAGGLVYDVADNRANIGQNRYDGAGDLQQFTGQIDDVGIWNRALTLAEIQELYLSGLGNQYPFGNATPLSTLQRFYWPLDGSGSDLVQAVDATVSGPTFGTGKLGSNGAVFTSGNVLGLTVGALGSKWSFSMWLFPTANATQGIMTESNNTHGFFRRSDGTFSWYDGSFYDFTASNNSPLSTWTHILVTHDSGVIKFYYNGVLDPISFSIASISFNPIRVGADQFGNNYVGTIDEVGVWTRTLTAADATALYNAGTGIQYPYGEAAPALSSGVRGSWKLDGDSTDPVGGANGTDTAITYSGANGKINNGAGFNGSSSFIDVGSANLNITKEISISCWAKNNNTSNYHMIATRGPSAGATYELRFEITTGTVTWIRGASAILSPSGPTIGVFHHIVVTGAQNGTGKIYVDGVLVQTGTVGTPGNLPTTSSFIGKRNDGFFYDGAIDELVIWDRVLTQADVTALYNAGTGLQYPF